MAYWKIYGILLSGPAAGGWGITRMWGINRLNMVYWKKSVPFFHHYCPMPKRKKKGTWLKRNYPVAHVADWSCPVTDDGSVGEKGVSP